MLILIFVLVILQSFCPGLVARRYLSVVEYPLRYLPPRKPVPRTRWTDRVRRGLTGDDARENRSSGGEKPEIQRTKGEVVGSGPGPTGPTGPNYCLLAWTRSSASTSRSEAERTTGSHLSFVSCPLSLVFAAVGHHHNHNRVEYHSAPSRYQVWLLSLAPYFWSLAAYYAVIQYVLYSTPRVVLTGGTGTTPSPSPQLLPLLSVDLLDGTYTVLASAQRYLASCTVRSTWRRGTSTVHSEAPRYIPATYILQTPLPSHATFFLLGPRLNRTQAFRGRDYLRPPTYSTVPTYLLSSGPRLPIYKAPYLLSSHHAPVAPIAPSKSNTSEPVTCQRPACACGRRGLPSAPRVRGTRETISGNIQPARVFISTTAIPLPFGPRCWFAASLHGC